MMQRKLGPEFRNLHSRPQNHLYMHSHASNCIHHLSRHISIRSHDKKYNHMNYMILFRVTFFLQQTIELNTFYFLIIFFLFFFFFYSASLSSCAVGCKYIVIASSHTVSRNNCATEFDSSGSSLHVHQ